LYKRLGIELRTISPVHPEANLAERHVGTAKKMLHHLILESKNPRSWHTKLQYLCFAYREVVHSSTSLAPARLVFGKNFRGPLSIVHDALAHDNNQPDSTRPSTTAAEYLEELDDNLATAVKIAQDHSLPTQEKYTERYNQSAVEKQFDVGDQVLFLKPDTTNSLLSRWTGPATITAVISPYSYRVALPKGASRTIHANHLRKFFPRVNGVAVLFDDDESQFGEVIPYESQPPVEEFQQRLDQFDLSHLSAERRSQLRELLTEFKEIFSDKPGCCKGVQHEVPLREGFQPKPQKSYRIPEKFVPEVKRQLAQLEADGKIRVSSSPFSHPLVVVAKKSGELRICIDRFVTAQHNVSPYTWQGQHCSRLFEPLHVNFIHVAYVSIQCHCYTFALSCVIGIHGIDELCILLLAHTFCVRFSASRSRSVHFVHFVRLAHG
jgi:hypothetical protein